jgi:RES domain-containing protein
LSLAVLETLVHVSVRFYPTDMIATQLDIPALLHSIQTPVQANWQHHEGHTRAIGSNWLRQKLQTGVLVPSAIIPMEYNVLINPAHEDFYKITILEQHEFSFDKRLFTRA